MHVYAQHTDGDTLVTALKEHVIYGAQRLGLELRGGVIRKECPDCGTEGQLPDESARYAPLVVAELLYDSPLTPGDARPGTEAHTGEYAVLLNTSGRDLDLTDYRLRSDAGVVDLSGTLAPGARAVVARHTDAAAFAALVGLPDALLDNVQLSASLALPDRGGMLLVEHTSGAIVDAMAFGGFFGLSAGNPYLPLGVADSAATGSLTTVQRHGYGGPVGLLSSDDAAVGDAEPTIEPSPKDRPVGGRYLLERGLKAYEFANHLGNSQP